MITNETIILLVRAAMDGEEVAWDRLYREFQPLVYATALKICGNVPSTVDLVQDAFIAAFVHLHELKDPSAFGSWLKQIITHSCYRSLENQIRKNNFLKNYPDNWWEDQLDQKYEQLNKQSRLYTSLSMVPETLRSVLLLRYFSNYNSYEEISNILGIPVGTVRSRLNQSKIKLAEQWNQHSGVNRAALKENEEWNNYYHSLFTGVHWYNDYKRKFLDHLQKNVVLVFGPGMINCGSRIMDGMFVEDNRAGSFFKPQNVHTCGNLSVIEAKHFNSPEFPDHCPDTTVCVMHREKGRVVKMNLYFAKK